MSETGSGREPGQTERASFVVAIVALCFSALAASWSFVGGACCGWAGWGWAFIGLVLSIVSLVMKRSVLGWWAFGLAAFAFLWVFVSLGSWGALSHSAVKSMNAR